jgi:hypothetical protein
MFVAMFTTSDVRSMKKIYKHGFPTIVEILKEVASSSLPCQFINIHPSFSPFDVNNLLWSIEGSIFLIHCLGIDEFAANSFVNNYVYNFAKLDPYEANLNMFGLIFYPYVILDLDDFDICVGPHSFDFFVDPNQEIIYFILTSNVI